MKKLAIILGTRPEAVKYGPVIKVLKKDHRFELCVISTGQHKEMLEQALMIFDIIPDVELNIMKPGQSLCEISTKIMNGLQTVLPAIKPSAIIVHGDTATTLAGALAGFYQQIPVIHVEAGLRSGHLHSPFPEEGNRKLVAQIAALHLAPTPGNATNLLREGIKESNIVITGNTGVDALKWAIGKKHVPRHPIFNRLGNDRRKLILASAHRRESWHRLPGIVNAISSLAKRGDVLFIIPLHKNPVIRQVFVQVLSHSSNVLLIEPLDYLDFCHLMKQVDIILSDSSGAEEEGPTLGKPTLVLRNVTERPEATLSGSATLIGTSESRIVSGVASMLDNLEHYSATPRRTDHYGDGHASTRVIDAIARFLGI